MAIPTYGPKQGPDQDSIQDGRMTSPTPTPTSIPVDRRAAERLTVRAPSGQRTSQRVAVVLKLQADRRARQV